MTRGPVPKRSTERRRRNKDSQPDIVEVTGALDVEYPPASSEWHPTAAAWYESLGLSGQAQFYQPSDWATAQYVAEAMSRNLSSTRLSGQLFAAVMAAMTELLTTEGARRRARVELERAAPTEAPPEVAIMAKYRRAAGQ